MIHIVNRYFVDALKKVFLNNQNKNISKNLQLNIKLHSTKSKDIYRYICMGQRVCVCVLEL